VARQAADKMQQQMQQHGKQAPGHVVLVGNPLPTRLHPLPFAEEEVKDSEDILKRAGVDVHKEAGAGNNSSPQWQQHGGDFARLPVRQRFRHCRIAVECGRRKHSS
jgi:hypothetical protein